MNSIPPFSKNRADIKYIKFEILQIVSPSEDVKFSNVRGLYLRKYGISKPETSLHTTNANYLQSNVDLGENLGGKIVSSKGKVLLKCFFNLDKISIKSKQLVKT